MAKVYSLDIHDERQAKLARDLMHLHVGITGMSCLYAAIMLAKALVARGPSEKLFDSFGAESAGDEHSRSSVSVAVVKLVFSWVPPGALLYFVHQAIKKNKRSWIQCICLLNGGCCILLSFCFVWILWEIISDKMLQDHVGTKSCFISQDQADCEKSVLQLYVISLSFSIVSATMVIISAVLYGVSTFKAIEALDSLQQGNIFVRPPQLPATIPGKVVAGQAIGQAVLEGSMPVQMGKVAHVDV